MIGVQAQRPVEGELRVGAAVRAEQRNGHAQQGGSDVAAVVVAGGGVGRLEAGGQAQELARVRGDRFHVAFHQRDAGERRDHFRRFRPLRQ